MSALFVAYMRRLMPYSMTPDLALESVNLCIEEWHDAR